MEWVDGVDTVLPVLETIGDADGVWYDVYVQLGGANVVMYAGIRGQEMEKIVDATTGVAASTDRIEVRIKGAAEFLFDDMKVMTRPAGNRTFTYTYGPDR